MVDALIRIPLKDYIRICDMETEIPQMKVDVIDINDAKAKPEKLVAVVAKKSRKIVRGPKTQITPELRDRIKAYRMTFKKVTDKSFAQLVRDNFPETAPRIGDSTVGHILAGDYDNIKKRK
jgi:hypothetical protein